MTAPADLHQFLLAAGEAGFDWDLASDSLQWYGATAKLFGAAAPPATGSAFLQLIHADDQLTALSPDGDGERRYRLLRGDEQPCWVLDHGSYVTAGERPVRRQGLLRPLDEFQQHALRGESQGRDSLTGCLSRGAMLALIAKARAAQVAPDHAAKRADAYLVVGIDKMSMVNMAVGMHAGDALICGVAARLVDLMPPKAQLARVGGDMFGLLLPEPIDGEVQKLATLILQDFREQPVATPATPVYITVSIGGLMLDTPHRAEAASEEAAPAAAANTVAEPIRPAEAMIFAEQALHDARKQGRNKYMEYLNSPSRSQENRQLLELGERIKRAFKHDGYRLAFQPVVDTASGQILFYEALVRMFERDGTPVPAAHFVPAIEQLGLAVELDQRVLDLALVELAAAPNLTLAINVSGLTASMGDWPAHIRAKLAGRRDLAERLIVEVTETAAIVDIGATKVFVETLRELGGRIALDDFGAGFTSLSYLRSLAPSIMKIDKALIHNLLTDTKQQILVQTLIELARGLGIKTVVEGIENAPTADWLRARRADMLQGYHFGKPLLDRPWLGDDATPSLAVRV